MYNRCTLRNEPLVEDTGLRSKVEDLEKSSIAIRVVAGGVRGRKWGVTSRISAFVHLRPLGRANRIHEINYLHLHKPP